MILTVTVTGQRGAGKSRLAARIRNQLIADGFNCHKIEERQPPANTGASFIVFEAVSVLNRLDASSVGTPSNTASEAEALINGRTHAERVEATEFACEAGPLTNNYDWLEFKRCFETLAQYVEVRQQSGEHAERGSAPYEGAVSGRFNPTKPHFEVSGNPGDPWKPELKRLRDTAPALEALASVDFAEVERRILSTMTPEEVAEWRRQHGDGEPK